MHTVVWGIPMREEFFADQAMEGDSYFSRHLVQTPRPIPGVEPPWINRDYYDAYIIPSGRGQLQILGSDGRIRPTELRQGRIYLWRPQDRRCLTASSDPIEFYQIGIRAAEWQAFTSFLGIPPVRQTAPEAPSASFDLVDDDVTPLFEAITRAAHRGASLTELGRFLIEIVPRLFSPSALGADTAPPWLFAGVEAMREEDNLRIGMPRFLELTRVSKRQLGRLTRKYFGTTPWSILLESRVRHAMWLLMATSENMESIADRCGFASAAYFSYRFREATGMRPSDYRDRSARGFHGVRAPRPLTPGELAAGLRTMNDRAGTEPGTARRG